MKLSRPQVLVLLSMPRDGERYKPSIWGTSGWGTLPTKLKGYHVRHQPVQSTLDVMVRRGLLSERKPDYSGAHYSITELGEKIRSEVLAFLEGKRETRA